MVLGALACWPAFLIARRSALLVWPSLHDSASHAGALAGLLVAVEPIGLRYSGLTFAEVPCTFFVLAACAALLPDERGRPARWWLAVPCLALACGLRYESWLLAPLMLLCTQLPRKERVALTLAAVAPASLWVIDRPRYLALNSVTRKNMVDILPSLEAERIESIVGLSEVLLANTLPAVLPLAIIGVIVMVRARAPLVLPLAALGGLAFPPLSALVGHVPLLERYLQLPVTLLGVAACVGVVACAQRAASITVTGGIAPPSRATLWLLSVALLLSLLPGTVAGVSEVLDKGVPLTAPAASILANNPEKVRADLIAQGTWQELDETALLLRDIAADHPNLLVYIEPNLRTASYLYWHARIPPQRVAGFYQWPRDDKHWHEELNKVLWGWPAALYVLVTAGGEGSAALGLPGPEVACSDLQQHRAGNSRMRCLGASRAYRIFWVTPIASAVLHQENDLPRSNDSEAAPGPTW